jgi:hypothetical protein
MMRRKEESYFWEKGTKVTLLILEYRRCMNAKCGWGVAWTMEPDPTVM